MIIQTSLIKINILLCIILILSKMNYNINLKTIEIENDKQEITKAQNKKEALPILLIDKINLEKPILYQTLDNAQKTIDENKIVMTGEYSTSKENIIYGHYTNVDNLVFNKIYNLEKTDIIKIDINSKIYQYEIVETGVFEKSNKKGYNTLDNSIVILTCTKDFDINKHYYIQAKLKET